MNIERIIEGDRRAQRQAITDDTARFVEKHAQTLNLGPDVLAGLQQGLADVNRLVHSFVFWAERLLERLYTSVYHQRLHAISPCRQAACWTPPAGSGSSPMPTPRSQKKPNSSSTS
uniref:Uncharacterized protein n=1 Tax=Candidatus Kentrum sp. DK TaxID=2126562 RepID=A0A450SZF7_9GAMM|nr:MAG: hypothetical protein BECKDK2373C_GA0170839_107133 [Candidatus Kentron sp. DK]